MGAHRRQQIINLCAKNMRTFMLILAVVALAAALPEDQTVPETSFTQVMDEDAQIHAEAVEELRLLQETRSDNACKKLATSTINQKMLNRLYTGHKCHTEGVKAQNAAKKRKDTATRNYSNAKKKYNKTRNAQVDFGRYTFSSLRENSCGAFYREGNYRRAKTNYKNAKNAQTRAHGAHKQATKAHKDAVAAAKRQQKNYRCRVKKQHSKSWGTANKNNGANAKAWKKAKHMLCVLSGTPQNRCNTGGLRK